MKRIILLSGAVFLFFAFFIACEKDEAEELPSVKTGDITDITVSSAVAGGDVTDDGGADITERGFYYGTSSGPEATGTKVEEGSGKGDFSSTLSGLDEGTTYYVVAYATNSQGTAYGDEKSFVPTDALPGVVTREATDISDREARVRGEVTEDGGNKVTQRGVYMSESSPADENGEKIIIGEGKGTFSREVDGLDSETTYYVVSFATNGVGTGFGDEKSFDTQPPKVLDSVSFTYGGRSVTYGAVEYNDRVWLDRNLGAERAATDIDDEDAFGDLFQWGREVDGHQDRTSSTRDVLALSGFQPGHDEFILAITSPNDWNVDCEWLDRWVDESDNKKEADPCPEGWRVPTREELQSLSNNWDDREDAFNSPLRLPSAGRRSGVEGNVLNEGVSGYYWSSSGHSDVSFFLYIDTANVSLSDDYRAAGYSVRCIRKE